MQIRGERVSQPRRAMLLRRVASYLRTGVQVRQRHLQRAQDCSLFPLLVRVFTFCFLRFFNFLGFRLCV